MSNELIDELSPNQKRAYTRMQKYLERGFSITESADRAGVAVSDFNNARARLRKLQNRIKPVGTKSFETNQNFDHKTYFVSVINTFVKTLEELREFFQGEFS